MIRIGKFDIHRFSEWHGSGVASNDLWIRSNEAHQNGEGEGMQVGGDTLKELEKLIEEFFIKHM